MKRCARCGEFVEYDEINYEGGGCICCDETLDEEEYNDWLRNVVYA